MTKKLQPIQFTVIDNGNKIAISSHHGSHPNLMFLLKEKLSLDSFGECGGVGRCATCLVKAVGVKGKSVVKERNEPATLSKLGYEAEAIRLSCQLYVTADLDGAVITILED